METEREDCHGDEADRASYYVETVIDDHVKEAMRRAADMPVGESGECYGCGDFFLRLVDGMCGRCRDRFAKFYR